MEAQYEGLAALGCVSVKLRSALIVAVPLVLATHADSAEKQKRAEAYKRQVGVTVREVDRLRNVVVVQQTEQRFKSEMELAKALLGCDLKLENLRNVQLSGILRKQSATRTRGTPRPARCTHHSRVVERKGVLGRVRGGGGGQATTSSPGTTASLCSLAASSCTIRARPRTSFQLRRAC